MASKVTFPSSYVTSTLPVSKLTCTSETPANFFKAPSTDSLQWLQDMPRTSNVVVCIISPPLKAYIFTLFRRSELVTTLTELNAIAAPAIHGARKPKAAIGIPAVLYPNAQNRFCRIQYGRNRSEEHTSELQSRENLVCRLLLEKKK